MANKNKITIDEAHDIYWNPEGARFKHNIVIFISFSLIDKRATPKIVCTKEELKREPNALSIYALHTHT